MPHDKNGQLLKVGDKVNVPCTVKVVQLGKEYCNLSVETDELMYPGDNKSTVTLNSKQVVKAVIAFLAILALALPAMANGYGVSVVRQRIVVPQVQQIRVQAVYAQPIVQQYVQPVVVQPVVQQVQYVQQVQAIQSYCAPLAIQSYSAAIVQNYAAPLAVRAHVQRIVHRVAQPVIQRQVIRQRVVGGY